VTLTGKGLDIVDRAVGAGLAEQQAALSRLDDEQAGQLAGLLRELLAGTQDAPH
jgi:hypothetical protein